MRKRKIKEKWSRIAQNKWWRDASSVGRKATQLRVALHLFLHPVSPRLNKNSTDDNFRQSTEKLASLIISCCIEEEKKTKRNSSASSCRQEPPNKRWTGRGIKTVSRSSSCIFVSARRGGSYCGWLLCNSAIFSPTCHITWRLLVCFRTPVAGGSSNNKFTNAITFTALRPIQCLVGDIMSISYRLYPADITQLR